ncbi:MAG: hypothetical protein BWY97_00049 [Tenericutes bacterium ADurb.BinA124]|nr:MAG: hypothetical protein BWY97_00049 [Tenericutes bacterium ADurb.BinA124]
MKINFFDEILKIVEKNKEALTIIMIPPPKVEKKLMIVDGNNEVKIQLVTEE